MDAQPTRRLANEPLDLRVVRYVVAVAEELHFGRAATILMVSQQTLSAQIRRLETRLGVPLFVRDRRRVELTAAGQVFVERGRRLLADAEDLLGELARVPLPIRIDIIQDGSSPSVIARHLQAQFPDTTIQLYEGSGLGYAVSRLLSGELDLAFGRVHGIRRRWPATLQHAIVFRQPIGVALPADHPLADEPEVGVARLAEFPILLYSGRESSDWHNWQEDLVETFDLSVGRRLRGYGPSFLSRLALTHGLPVFASMNDPGGDGAVVRPVVDPVPLFPCSAVWRENRRDPRLPNLLCAMHEFVASRGWLGLPDRPWWMPRQDTEDVEPAGPGPVR